jgi:predicted O-linked N-acetylglucosamine transferase (SPINDLY family)
MTAQTDLMAAAWKELHAGRPTEAERLGFALLQTNPNDAHGWYLLGTVHHSLGRPAEAIDSYARALRLRPDFPEVRLNRGTALLHLGRPEEAIADYQHALKLWPNSPEAHNNLGNAWERMGRHDAAEACFRETLRLRPDFPDAHNNLGNALRAQGRLAEAVHHLRRAVDLHPDYAEAHFNLGMVQCQAGQLDEAEASFRQALRLQPDVAEAWLSLGNVLRDRGRLPEALDCHVRAVQLRPTAAEAHNSLGSTFRDLGRTAEAEASHAQALRLRPDFAEGHNNLGAVLRDQGRLSAAEASLARALALRPHFPAALHNLGQVLLDQGRTGEAVASFRRALEQQPSYRVAHDGLLMTLQYRPGVTPEQLAAVHAEYDRRHPAPLRAQWRPHTNDRDPDRPLRLGLVSPDFGRHPVGYLLVRAAEALARRPGTVVCYSDRRTADDLTARFRASASVWSDTAGLADAALADQVRADGIDVLIDLAGHTAGNRLLTFARKPAPVQATWLGYVGTTGLEAMDYLIADDRHVPPGHEAHHRETVLRLPGGYTAYDPPTDAPEPGPLPALATGRVTFGCFNNPAKLSDPTLAAFAEILRRVPGSRLVLKYRGVDDPAVGTGVRDAFAATDIAPERVELRGGSAHADHMAAYRDLDTALDTFPYSGGVTTCEALWMGVPVVTLPGATFASRHGFSHITSVGLADELAAHDADDYAARAARLAHDLDRLADLRAGLRERVARSPLCDGDRLANELLAALRGAWRAWAYGGGQ